jgi:hypothetical protein
MENVLWNLKECVPIEHIEKGISEKYASSVNNDNMVHSGLVRIFNVEGMVDLHLVLKHVELDLKRIVDEDVMNFHTTDYKQMVINRKKLV